MIYKDANAPIDARVADLLSRMTLREKVRQMDMYSGEALAEGLDPIDRKCTADSRPPSEDAMRAVIGAEGIGCVHDLYPTDARIPNAIQAFAMAHTRLGIPVLFSEEALHGLCSAGNTIFPQMIALAATFNRRLALGVGRGIAAEMRTKGLHLAFAPVLELARDPRWGRAEETFGEDAYLAGEMAHGVISGMHGDSPSSPTSILAEPKHFAMHSISAGGCNCAPVSAGERELRRDYLPVWRRAMDAGALSVMCAYHATDGVPCAADAALLKDILRGELGFRGFVCSDLGAIRRLRDLHRVAETPEDAIRQAVAAGVDMQFYDYDHALFQGALVEMVESGELPLSEIDRAAGCVLRAKFELGLFDRPLEDPAAAARYARRPEHLATALDAARECVCLLKNDGALPIDAGKVRRVAIVGPGAFQTQLGDYSAPTRDHPPSPLWKELEALLPEGIELVAERGVDVTGGAMRPVPARLLCTPDGAERGLLGEYFNDLEMAGAPALTRVDRLVDFNFITRVPGGGVEGNQFAARWTGYLVARGSGEVTLGVDTSDRAKLYLDDRLIADSSGERTARVHLEAGARHAIRLEYVKRRGGGERMRLGLATDYDGIDRAAALAAESDLAIVALSENEDVCGEGRDRADLSLPGRQSELLRAVAATGTPAVLVLMHGRALAEVLVGQIDPSGRLPVSFPRSAGQLPVYYGMLNDTGGAYVDDDGRPTYRFGDGLSYTSFEYADLAIDARGEGRDFCARVSAAVRNVGRRAGVAVAMLFIADRASSTVKPRLELKGFEKLRLEPGEAARVAFELDAAALSTLGRDMRWALEPGAFTVRVGPNATDGAEGEFIIPGVGPTPL
ncbi:MAG: beta-glucosidase [Clostridiales bacterium]|nr:beta-glucosidase [Clostridiales bacterium]